MPPALPPAELGEARSSVPARHLVQAAIASATTYLQSHAGWKHIYTTRRIKAGTGAAQQKNKARHCGPVSDARWKEMMSTGEQKTPAVSAKWAHVLVQSKYNCGWMLFTS